MNRLDVVNYLHNFCDDVNTRRTFAEPLSNTTGETADTHTLLSILSSDKYFYIQTNIKEKQKLSR